LREGDPSYISTVLLTRSTSFARTDGLPATNAGQTTSLVTLHSPLPEIRILAPIFFAPSIATTRKVIPRSRAVRPAKIAAIIPAAPAPMTARS